MAITNAAIAGLQLSLQAKAILTSLNNATATAEDIQASLTSIADKAAMRDVLATTATRAGIMSRPIDFPMKVALLGIAGV